MVCDSRAPTLSVPALTGLRQDSLLTTITTATPSYPFPVAEPHPTTMSLCEELRKQQQYQHIGWSHHARRWVCHRWCLVLLLVFLALAAALVLFFCWPRLPLVAMASTADTFGLDAPDWGPPQSPFYHTTWQLNLTLDNRPNFIPLHLRQVDLVLNMLNYNSDLTIIPFASTSLSDLTLVAKQDFNAVFAVNYTAVSSNLTDPTFAQFYNACGPHMVNNPPALNVSLDITFHFWHFIWLPTLTVHPPDDTGLICPSN
ncbi:hypothetical protein DM01DRAFT_310216 [Hesseltinella vesiculosa]|uniref:Uncharacterized protein n=1 Tax=Hesseltinella vesiculosa TaxID=101127 RepID=A0A1X2GAJ1_9FUNG|nr:hypothetical protein DM01DRAFT_310216 [Hesseltinella vesiculosa]